MYGIWTERPPAPPDNKKKPDAENKAEAAAKKEDKPDAAKAPPKPRGTVVKVGVADFKMAWGSTSPYRERQTQPLPLFVKPK